MAVTPDEVVGWLGLALPSYDKVRAAIEELEAIPKEQRKPSHFIGCANKILGAVAPLADKVDEDVKD